MLGAVPSLLGLVLALGPAAAGADAVERRLRLPTPQDGVAFAAGAETIFFGSRGVETVLPGPVRDEERVEVSFGPDGRILAVIVTQRLTVTGLGDFQFKVPGPARDVETLPASEAPAGLRRGSVLWQGFSPGEKLLAARMPLFPEQEAERLPVAIELSMTVDGEPLASGRPAEGDLEIRLGVRNVSAIPVSVSVADADPRPAAATLDTLRRHLAAGRRPVPGERGLPAALPASGPVRSEVRQMEAPFALSGRLSFPPGAVSDLEAHGGRVVGDAVAFSGRLGGGDPMALEVRVSGRARGLELPEIEMTGAPAFPSEELVRPPAGESWRGAAEAGRVDGRGMASLAMDVLWRSARVRQFDAYLGNPDPTGPARTGYRFALTEPPSDEPAPTAALPVAEVDPLGYVWIALAALLALVVAVVAWAHA